ncbi:hypothetical protein QQ045_007201 [Rhodiola kirilowii]
MDMERTPCDILMELGYGCAENTARCKEVLYLFLALPLAVGNGNISDLPSMSSWNVDVLLDSIKKLDPFPLHTICGFIWKNTEGQKYFLQYAVSAQQEVFTCTHSTKKLNLALVLEMVLIYFGIRLASLASRKHQIDLEKWLISHVNTYIDYFFEPRLVFLKETQLGEVQNVSPRSSNDYGALLNL